MRTDGMYQSCVYAPICAGCFSVANSQCALTEADKLKMPLIYAEGTPGDTFCANYMVGKSDGNIVANGYCNEGMDCAYEAQGFGTSAQDFGGHIKVEKNGQMVGVDENDVCEKNTLWQPNNGEWVNHRDGKCGWDSVNWKCKGPTCGLARAQTRKCCPSPCRADLSALSRLHTQPVLAPIPGPVPRPSDCADVQGARSTTVEDSARCTRCA